jgi:hypothetical protein
MVICWWRQRQRLGICSRQTLTAATLLAIVVATIAPGSTLAVAAATPTALGDTIFFMKLSDNPTIIGIVGVLLVENTEAATSTFIALGVVPVALLMIRLHREDSSLLSLGVLGLQLWGKRLRQVVHEEPSLLSHCAAVGDLEEPDNGSQLIIHRQLLPHLDVGDARGERGDDLLIGDPGNLITHLAEALDVLTKCLAFVLTHHVGDIPNRYTSDVVLNQQARVAHQGWYGGFAIPGGPVAEIATAVLDAGAYGVSGDKPMADC